MRLRLGFVAVVLEIACAASLFAGSVSNKLHRVEVTNVEKTPTLFGNMRPRTPGAVYLLVHISTDDPCFDANKNQGCFDPSMTPLAKVAFACGEIEIAGQTVVADGGGLIEGKLACGFVVPEQTTGTLVLRLRGYPDLRVAIKSSQSSGFPEGFDPKKPTVKLIYVTRRRADALRIAHLLTRLAVNVKPLELEEWQGSDHVGKIYHCPDALGLAKKVAASIASIEPDVPTPRECKSQDDPQVIVWVAR